MAEQTKPGWAPERLRGILDKAKQRHMELRELDLSEYDHDLVQPDGSPQTVQVWVNAPSALMDFISDADWSDTAFYGALGELTAYEPQMWRDLFDAWDAALKSWTVRKLFDLIRAYRDERFSFLVSSPADSTASSS